MAPRHAARKHVQFSTYTEFQCPDGRDHHELIWDLVAVGEQADELGFDVFTCLEHPFFENFAVMPAPCCSSRRWPSAPSASGSGRCATP